MESQKEWPWFYVVAMNVFFSTGFSSGKQTEALFRCCTAISDAGNPHLRQPDIMKKEIIRLTNDFVVFSAEKPKEIGTEANLDIRLPQDTDLDSFSVRGTITDCRHVLDNGNSRYVIEMNIGELPEKNRMILDAYVNFLEREKVLDKMRKDNEELQKAIHRLREKLMEVIVVSELLIKESQGELVIH